jgi:proline iminopeptidase
MIGSPAILESQEYERGAAEIWKTASPDRKKLQDSNWAKLPDFKKFPSLQPDIENYLAMAPKYWFNPKYDARWLWNGMTVNADMLHHMYNEIFANYHIFTKQPTVSVPTFLAEGMYDYVIPHTQWDPYRWVPNLTVKYFTRSGHTPQLEQPREFDQALLKWMSKK